MIADRLQLAKRISNDTLFSMYTRQMIRCFQCKHIENYDKLRLALQNSQSALFLAIAAIIDSYCI